MEERVVRRFCEGKTVDEGIRGGGGMGWGVAGGGGGGLKK